MEFLVAASFDIARLITMVQGVALIGLIIVRISQVWNIPHRFYNIAPLVSWVTLVTVGAYDSFLKLGTEHIEWWRSPARCIAYAIGIAGMIFVMSRDRKTNLSADRATLEGRPSVPGGKRSP